MKVLLLNTSDRKGGAAVACARLMHALKSSGVEVSMVVMDKTGDDPDIIPVGGAAGKARFMGERAGIWASNGFSRKDLFAISTASTGKDISRMAEVRDADIIHIHWVNQGFLSLKDISKLIGTGKPVVWTMHDMWPFTGICHYSGECRGYETSCGKCPKLRYPSGNDLSGRIFNKKKRMLADADIAFAGCSRWISSLAEKSPLTKGHPVIPIPNPIDTTTFIPKDRSMCRKALGLPDDKKLLLFGADRIDDPRKGFGYFAEALDILLKEHPGIADKVEIIAFGGQKSDVAQRLPFKVHSPGYISDADTIVALYNAADLFVIPSLEDNLPNTVMEAMSCGTPVAGFGTGGIPEMVDNGLNGFITPAMDSRKLAEAIYDALFCRDNASLREEARKKVTSAYSEERVAGLYISLYKELADV